MATGPGQLLAGRYRLRTLLGQGGMGVVWRAYDELLGREVAVKEVLWPPELSASDQQVLFRRTVREARAAARLNHPAAVTVFDVVEEHGRPWIVMEFVRSRSLAQAVQEDGLLPPSQAARIGLEVLGALAAAHAAGILHRDVKPGNVLLAEDNRVVLTDFGIAALEGDATLTAAGAVMGSAAYISPERARGGQAEPASDLWSLGVTLYAAVEGRTPHERGGAIPTLLSVATEEPDPPQRAGPLTPILQGLLRRDPASRLNTDDAGRLLRAVAAGSGGGIPPDLPPPATRPDLASGARTRVLPLPGHASGPPSTVTSAVPPATRTSAVPPATRTSAGPPDTRTPAVPPGASHPPVPAANGPGGLDRNAPRRRYVALLAALAGLAIAGLVTALLLSPGHPGSHLHPPATSPRSATSAGSTAPSPAASPGTTVATSPGTAGGGSAGSSGPSASPSGAASPGGTTQPTPTGAGASP